MEDLAFYGSTNHQLDNMSSPQGGSIDLSKKIMLNRIDALSTIFLVSDFADDRTQTYLIEGVGRTRNDISEIITLDGLVPVESINPYYRIDRIIKQSGDPLVGNVTIYNGTKILVTLNPESVNSGGTDLTPESTTAINLFARIYGHPTQEVTYYDKFFIRNNTGDVINSLLITEYQSDFSNQVFFAVDPDFNDNSTSLNRITSPVIAGLTSDTPILIESIPSLSSIGIWVSVTLNTGESVLTNGWQISADYDGVEDYFYLVNPEADSNTLTETIDYRNESTLNGGNPIWYAELLGAKMVTESFYEPDPITFRDQFYYNTRLNRLFKKINTIPKPVWKSVR